MADKMQHNQEHQEHQDIQKTPDKKWWILKAAALSAVLLWTQVQANDLLKQCDFNKDWIISTRRTYEADWVPKEIARKETKCKIKFRWVKIRKKLVQNKQELAQEKIVLAQLDITVEWLKKEIKKIKEELSKNKEELERKLKLLMEQLEKIEKWAKNV